MTKKKQSFESSLEELEKIVTLLEDGDQSLEESLRLFENGVKLTRDCQQRLDDAERKIQILLRDSAGEAYVEDFDKSDSELT
ncbi:MAG: exodeoxyribonuclease VII small subunit [Acidobacteriota bacterium]|nr:exodeoxyribonuclease VII small subunit [Acidobacteriota bacterium]MDH3529190.1 exodeoxyribonuclease VII small subunit [Acidobacteriota bacterium]